MLGRTIAILLLSSTRLLAETTAIRAGTLIDPATGSAARGEVILVKDGKIIEVGPRVIIPKEAETIDLSGWWVMPGLMDVHTHLTFQLPSGEDVVASYLKESSALRALRGARNARDVLEAGFTTVRDMGNDASYAAADVRRALGRGWFPGPTLFTAGKIIAPFGGQSSGIPPEQGRFWGFEYIDADAPDEMRKAVRENIYYGANVIKLVADNSPFYYSVEEIQAAVNEAHRAGLKVSVHVMGGDAARNVILGGADSIEHGFQLSDELLALMKEKGTVLVGTDYPTEHLLTMGTAGGILPDPKILGETIVDRLRRAHRLGVKMAFGSDVVLELSDRTRPELMLDYLKVWGAAGVPPAAILKCMTTEAASLLGIEKVRGASSPGQAADLIAIREDPLKDIQALRWVGFVMKDGKVIKR